MKQSYQQSITVETSPAEVYEALTTGYDYWWTSTKGKSFKKIGDNIKFTFLPNTSYWTLEAKTLLPNKFVELECVDAFHVISGKPELSITEWLGTKIAWSIESNGDKTDLHFTHDGLIPTLHCYEECKAGWDMFFVDSLKAYLNTGVGSPHTQSLE